MLTFLILFFPLDSSSKVVGAGLKAKLETKATREVTRKAFPKGNFQISASFPCDVREEDPMSGQGYSTSHA